jgi:hypothetical protein
MKTKPLTVERGILPIALAGSSAEGDLERAQFFLKTLKKHWKGRRPFELVVVTRKTDAAAVQQALVSDPSVTVRHYEEDFFFEEGGGFYRVPGWWKQQLIKLRVPIQLQFEGYFTFDADNICVRDFDETTFVRDGRLISQWEPKRCQDWWRTTAEWVGIPHDPQGVGLSVTPNIYHGFLTRQALVLLAPDPLAAMEKLVEAVEGSSQIVWAENPFYTVTAEAKGNLHEYHCPPRMLSAKSPRLHCPESVWWARTAEEFFGISPKNLQGTFLVIQSTSGIPLARIEAHLQKKRRWNWWDSIRSVLGNGKPG